MLNKKGREKKLYKKKFIKIKKYFLFYFSFFIKKSMKLFIKIVLLIFCMNKSFIT